MKKACITEAENRHDDRLSRLVRGGIVRPGRARLSQALLADQPPRLKGDASALRALIEERRENR